MSNREDKREKLINALEKYRKKQKKVTKAYYLSQLVIDEIENIAVKNNLSSSEIVNEILKDYLEIE